MPVSKAIRCRLCSAKAASEVDKDGMDEDQCFVWNPWTRTTASSIADGKRMTRLNPGYQRLPKWNAKVSFLPKWNAKWKPLENPGEKPPLEDWVRLVMSDL